jgi:hypothetical protein
MEEDFGGSDICDSVVDWSCMYNEENKECAQNFRGKSLETAVKKARKHLLKERTKLLTDEKWKGRAYFQASMWSVSNL